MSKERLPEYVVKTIEIVEQQREYPIGVFEVLQEIFMNDFTHTDITFSPQFDKTFPWIAESDRNICSLLRAFKNGYEVGEPKYHVQVKGLNTVTNYLNYDTDDKDFYTDVPDFLDCSVSRFTKSWLAKNWPEYEAYNNAGLLEFEEIEND